MQTILSRSLRLAAAGLIAIQISGSALRADEPSAGSSVPVSPKAIEKKKEQEAKDAKPAAVVPDSSQVQSSIPVAFPITLVDPNAPLPPPALPIVSPRLMCQGTAGMVQGGAATTGKSGTATAMGACSGTLPIFEGRAYFHYEGSAGTAGTLPVGGAKVEFATRNVGAPALQNPAEQGHPDITYAVEFRADPTVVGVIPFAIGMRLGSTDDARGSHVAAGIGVFGLLQDRTNGLGGLEFIEGQAEATLALGSLLSVDLKGHYGIYTADNSNSPVTVTAADGTRQKILPSSTGGSLLHLETDFRLHTGQNFWVAIYGSTDQLKYQVESDTSSGANIDLSSISWGAGLKAGGAIFQ